jgi:hypothetical protein
MYDASGCINIAATICSLSTVEMIWNLSRLKEDPRNPPLPCLLDVLVDSRLCRSTYPIDKVYGILGLVSPDDASKISIDYAVEAKDLYKQIALAEMSRIGLNMLYFCTKSAEKSTVDCPSWVPDWSQPCWHVPFFNHNRKNKAQLTRHTKSGGGQERFPSPQYKSSAAGNSSPKFRVEGNTLAISGRIVDTIQCVELARKIPTGNQAGETSKGDAPVCSKNEVSNDRQSPEDLGVDWTEEGRWTDARRPNPSDTVLDLQLWSHQDWFPNIMKIAFPDNILTPESYEALWRTCCCNSTTNGERPGADFGDSFPHWAKAMNGLKVRDFEEFQNRARKFMDSFSRFCDNRRFFRSEAGRLGWGPDQMRKGDVVCVVNGMDVPLVLRRLEKGFEVIGDAYVHGIMEGEIMDSSKEEEILLT